MAPEWAGKVTGHVVKATMDKADFINFKKLLSTKHTGTLKAEWGVKGLNKFDVVKGTSSPGVWEFRFNRKAFSFLKDVKIIEEWNPVTNTAKPIGRDFLLNMLSWEEFQNQNPIWDT